MATNTLGETKQVQFRLSPDTRAQLERIAAHYGLATASAAVRFLAKQEAAKIERKEKS